MEKTYEVNENSGNVKISDEVIATIAQIAANEVEGIIGTGTSFAGEIKQMLSKKAPAGKGVKVQTEGEEVTVDISVIVEYGAKIPAVSWEIQENVKKNVESMTGLSVRKVNVHIVGIEVKEDAASDDENKENTEETTEEN
ncbi:MAG: Asp23/Gls24 family envelope stress response protein [Clostridia bacterium]|nr:Asp23/Gls24 family envelope stress response protein [Oscillospiraceae bacterium]MDY5626337.1 Asp23/Gls24 family envelope stress response protein [Clostridia bacterium]